MASARDNIANGRANPNDNPNLGFAENFIQNNISTLELDFTSDNGARRSGRSIEDRFKELDKLFLARVDTAISTSLATKTKATMDALDEQASDLRIEDESGAEAALARLRQLIKDEGQRALESVGNLEQQKVDALLGDPKVDVTKLDRYKEKKTDNTQSTPDGSTVQPPIPVSTGGTAVRSEAEEQTKNLDRRARNNTIDSVG